MSNWEKVIQDKELLAKVKRWIIGLVIDSPQEIFDEMNRLTGNDWSREEYENHIFDYPDFYDWEEVAYALFHDGNYPERKNGEPFKLAKYRLKYMFDWRSGVCLWADNEAAKEKFNGYPVETCDLPISDELKATLEDLIYLYDEAFDFEKSNGDLLWDKNQIEEFLCTAREAYERLCEELGPGYEVELEFDEYDDCESKLEITLEDGEIKISGSLNLGYIGIFEDEQIELDDTLEEIREWDIVTENLDEDCTDEEIIKFLNQYFNSFADRITQNIDNINNTFLLYVFDDMRNMETDFREIDELYIEEKNYFSSEMDISEIYERTSPMLVTYAPYFEMPNDGRVSKAYVETVLRACFPMFDLDCFIRNIEPECIGLSDGSISFQCSDGFDNVILCGAYAVIDEELSFSDWHNF